MAEVKSELKLAKEALKKKEYKQALKHCKNVMKVEKDNYNALIFIGVCATELDNPEQAKQAYQRAINQNADLPLGWQGLCSLIEKSQIKEWKNELIDIYKKLLEFYEKEEKKWFECCKKLCDLLSTQSNYEELIKILHMKVDKTEKQSEKIVDLKALLQYVKLMKWNSNKEQAKKEFEIYQLLSNCFAMEENSDWEMEQVQYSEFLIKNLKLLDDMTLRETAMVIQRLFEKYPKNEIILTSLCKILLNLSLMSSLDENDIRKLELLRASEKPSHTRCLAMMYCLYEENKYKDALQASDQGLSFSRKDPLMYMFIALCNLKLHRYQQCEDALLRVDEFKGNFLSTELLNVVAVKSKLIHLEVAIERSEFHMNKEAIETIMSELIEMNDAKNNETPLLAHAYILCGELDKANQIIVEIDKPGSMSKEDCLRLKALVSVEEKNFDDAELRLQEALDLQEDFKSRYLLAKVYWEMGKEDKKFFAKAYREFLLAAKLDSNFPHIFYYLGKYQKDLVKDIRKAVKCFEKVFVLDSSNDKAMKELGDSYLQLGLHEKAYNIYEHITSNAKVGEATWAWVRLGLIHLKSCDPDNAVICFQHALRGDPSKSHYWECLAEGYMEKGSYTSALKAFSKSLELNSSSLFSRYKIAQIKQVLSLDSEAIVLYEKLLDDHPDYIPALLGLSETYLHLQKDYLTKRFDGRAVDCAQLVVENISRLINLNPKLISTWKILGDSLLSLYPVQTEKCKLSVGVGLMRMLSYQSEDEICGKQTILELAVRSYTMAVKLDETNAVYWHDLALTTFHLGFVIGGPAGRDTVLQSVKLVKHALSVDSTNPMIWNTLGVITGSSGPLQMCCGYSIDDLDNPALAQHAFIKALQLNVQDEKVWCNLGVLYLKHGKVEPAHEAFKRAQACNPAYAQAWIGQAMIAQTIADDDAMDLFRHSTELLFHEEGSQAYAQWVFRHIYNERHQSSLISTEPCKDYSHLRKPLSRIMSSSIVALARSIERLGCNACAYNTLGLLLEHEHLYSSAEQAFASARKILSSQQSNEGQNEKLRNVLLNQARVLRMVKKFDDAIEIYNILSVNTCEELSQLGLTYYKAQKFEEALIVYKKALNVAENDRNKSGVHAVIGMIEYVKKDVEAAKSNLFKSAQFNDCSEHGLLALTSLGLLHGDVTLATAALNELSKQNFSDSGSLETKKAKIFSSFFMLQGEEYKSKHVLCKSILRYPGNTTLWCLLTQQLKTSSSTSYKLVKRCLDIAKHHGPSEFVSKMEALMCESYPVEEWQSMMVVAQQLAHNYPNICESWILLASIIQIIVCLNNQDKKYINMLLNVTKLALSKVDNQLQSKKSMPSVGNSGQLTYYTKLYSWTMKQYIMVNIQYGDKELAQNLCTYIIPSLNRDDAELETFMFLRNLAVVCSHKDHVEEGDIEMLRHMSNIALKQSDKNLLNIMCSVYKQKGLFQASEVCERQLLQLSIQSNIPQIPLLAQMFISYIKLFSLSNKECWLEKSQQVIDELSKRKLSSSIFMLMKAIQFYYQGNKKAALKYIGKLKDAETFSDVCQTLEQAWK